jgi:threonylcarbamoyladenosine tRNA methylthiotransferase MtaB
VKTRVAFHTLGCKLNFSETSAIAGTMRERGFDTVSFQDSADIYVINTCSVTDNADKKCRRIIKSALKRNPTAQIAVIGCYAQLKPKEIANIPGVNVVLGAAEKFNLPEHLASLRPEQQLVLNAPIKETNVFVPGFSGEDRTRTFLKVQDGCDYFCSFCTIPLARGKSRSANLQETLKLAEDAIATGTKEIILTGVNLGDFGVDHDHNFYDLIQELDALPGDVRYRISSIEPNLLSDDIIRFVGSSQKFTPHFHIPLQSGSDEILIKMRRKYDSDHYRSRIELIREVMPQACIGVDVITGFPDESNDHFLTTYHFLNDLDINYLHVFPYSRREQTTANKMRDHVEWETRLDRATQLRSLSAKKKRAYYEQFVGSTHEVVFEEENHHGDMLGFTENYLRIRAPFNAELINEKSMVIVDEILPDLTCSINLVTEEITA